MSEYGITQCGIAKDGRFVDLWRIYRLPDWDDVVWEREVKDGEGWSEHLPEDLKAEYERLMGRPEFLPPGDEDDCEPSMVELVVDGEDCAFDQPCRHGHRVEGHAVYCHNHRWLYAPGKCRRTWYTGGRVRDEDCPGFEPNPQLWSGR